MRGGANSASVVPAMADQSREVSATYLLPGALRDPSGVPWGSGSCRVSCWPSCVPALQTGRPERIHWADQSRRYSAVMGAVVIYESMFGDNRQVALAIAEGLTAAGVPAEAIEVGVAPTAIPADIDLLVLGAPNHAWSLPRAGTRQDAATKTDQPLVSQGIGVREWLDTAVVAPGVCTASYDTRGSHPKAIVAFDHASTLIAKGLAGLGGVPVSRAEHFLVAGQTGPLEPGELDRARAWGQTLAGLLTR